MQPTERDFRIAAALILAAGLAASGLAILAEELGVGAAPEAFGWKRVGLLIAGGIGVGVGASLLARPRIVSGLEGMPSHLHHPSDRYPRYLAIGLMALLGVVLVWTRFAQISESFWHDEAVSVLTHNGPIAAFGGHVLYNQLSWATTSLLGESEAMHRLWSVAPGIAAVGFATWWAWLRIGIVTAVAFAALAVATPLHLDIAPQARGYGLTLLAATLMLIAADRLTRSYSRWTLAGFLGAGLVGIWTLIFFAFSFVGQALSLIRWPKLRPMVVGVVAVAAVVSFAFHRPFQHYGPGQVDGETISLGGALLLDRTLDWLVVPTATLLTVDQRPTSYGGFPDAPEWVAIAALALVVIAIVALWRRREAGLALILVVPPLFFNLAFSFADLETVARHQLVLLPHVLVLAAIGIVELGAIVARLPVLKPLALGAGVVAVLALAKATVDEGQARTLPREDFKGVANVVRDAGIDPVVTDSSRSAGLRYYLGDDLVILPSAWIESMLCERERPMIYIRHPFRVRSVADVECLNDTGSVRVRLLQRTRGRFIDVWIVPAASELARDRRTKPALDDRASASEPEDLGGDAIGPHAVDQ